jgi:hypothetical protein
MSGLRWRFGTVAILLVVGALGLNGLSSDVLTAEDKAAEEAATGAEESSAEEAVDDEVAEGEKDDADKDDKDKKKDKAKNAKKRKEAAKKKATKAQRQNMPVRRPNAQRKPNGAGAGGAPGFGNGQAGNAGQGPGGAPQNGGGAGGNDGAGQNPQAPPAGGQPPDPKLVDKVMKIQEKHTRELLKLKGVNGTATALDSKGNVVIRVYTNGVDKPVVPKTLEGIPVVVIERGPIFPLRGKFHRQDRISRPVPIGISAFVFSNLCATGTLGARMTCNEGFVLGLSNNHVFALENEAFPLDPIFQPGALDNFCEIPVDNEVGSLLTFVPIIFDVTVVNICDAAMMLTNESLLNTSTLSDGYGTPKTETVTAFLGQRVQKYGRTTGYRRGIVTAVNAFVVVGYDAGPALFGGQFEVIGEEPGIPPPFSQGGDSGSLVVDDQNRPVGLLFAGGGFPIDVTDCNPIDETITLLELINLSNLPMTDLRVDSRPAILTGKEGDANPDLP